MMHDFSRLGVQPMSSIDEDLRQRIIHQVEYWFSSENLFKDVFLRQNMDSQGFVSLQLLVTFKRLRDISDDVGTVLHSLLVSNEVEVLFNSERGPLVRPRAEPTKWIYPTEERVESARHPGPAPSFFQSHQDTMRQMQEGYQQYQYPQQYYFDPQYGFPGGPFQRPNDPESMSPHLDLSANSPVSPQFDPQNRKLSGHAPVFVPGYGPPMTNGESEAYRFRAMRNAIPTANEVEELVDVLDEENLATLVVIVHDNTNRPIPPALPVNGVNHSGQGTAESLRTPLQPVTWRIPDVTAATQGSTTTASAVSGPSSVTSPSSPSRTPSETALTERNLQRQISQSGSQEFLYPEFRQKALRSRESSLRQQKESTQMNNLYQFWADFLRDYWVQSMYTEFLKFAVDDANNGRRSGLSHLFAMYERVLESKFRTSLWNDFVRLAGEDYRNGRYGGIERVWRIRKTHRGGSVRIRDGDVSRLVDHEINQHDDIERLSRGVKPASVVLVPYTTVAYCIIPLTSGPERIVRIGHFHQNFSMVEDGF
jgi:la-related protein 1